MIIGAFLAFETRNVHSKFNESKYIGFAVYNIALIAVVIVPLSSVSEVSLNIRFIIRSIGILLIPAVTILTLFVPKVIHILFPSTVPIGNSGHSTQGASSTPKIEKSLGDTPLKNLTHPPPPPNEDSMDVLDQSLEQMRKESYDPSY